MGKNEINAMGRRQSGPPASIQEAFKMLDGMLSKEDKERFRSQTLAEFIVEQHFDLGLWVRNVWYFEADEETRRRLFGDSLCPDFASSEFLGAYQIHLKLQTMTAKDYLRFRAQYDDPDVFDFARAAFFAEHPDCPKPRPIERLDLIMKREYAQQIAEGKKLVEIRSYSEFYRNRLYDKAVLDYEDKHWDDELMKLQMLDFNDSVRAVKTIHFHDYNNSWFLDVECIENNTVVVNDDQVGYLQDEFGFHDFDEELAGLNKRKAKERPIFFYFAIGKIVGTNLDIPR